MVLRRTDRLLLSLVAALSTAGAALAQDADPIGTALEDPEVAQTAPPAQDVVAPPTTYVAPSTAPAPAIGPATAAVPTPPAPIPYVAIAPSPAQTALPPPGPMPAPGAGPRPYTPFPNAPPITAYSRPGPATANGPVHIGESGRTPDRPLSSYDMSYDARLRASFASAQGLLGVLDGSWTMNVPGVGDIYVLELADRSDNGLEGAWRDLRRIGSLNGSGFLEEIRRDGAALVLRFSPRDGHVSTATLTPQADGRWSGDLVERGDRKSVVLRRN